MAESYTLNQKKARSDFLINIIEKHQNEVTKGRSLYYDAWMRFRRNKIAMLSLLMLILITLTVIIAPWFSPYHFADQNLLEISFSPSKEHIFGTDSLGRDLFTRVMIGGRWVMSRRDIVLLECERAEMRALSFLVHTEISRCLHQMTKMMIAFLDFRQRLYETSDER